MESDDTNSAISKMGWVGQRKLLILSCENVIKKHVPCKTSKLIAEIEYETGLSNKKVKEMFNMFVKRGTVLITKDQDVILNDEQK